MFGFAIYQLNIQPNQAMLHLICADESVGTNIGVTLLKECEKRAKSE